MKHLMILFAAFLLVPLAGQAAEPVTNAIGMKLVRIEPGTFTMGQDGRPMGLRVLHPAGGRRACRRHGDAPSQSG
jgi:formylglycine-generating enzyme required for sulfatase activity